MPSPPDAPPLLVDERGGATGRLRDVRLPSPCLLAPCRFPASGDLALASSPPSSREISLPFMCRRMGRACGAVRSLRLLPRLNVSIIFKMFPRQCFKIMRLFDMARLCGYLGRFLSGRLVVPSPFHLGGLGRIACGFCVATRPFSVSSSVPAAFRSSLRPSRHDRLGGCLRDVPLLARRSDGRVLRSRRVRHAFVPLLAPCVPRIARRRIAPRIAAPPRSRTVSPLARSHHARIIAIAPPNRHERRGAGRGGCLLGVANVMARVG